MGLPWIVHGKPRCLLHQREAEVELTKEQEQVTQRQRLRLGRVTSQGMPQSWELTRQGTGLSPHGLRRTPLAQAVAHEGYFRPLDSERRGACVAVRHPVRQVSPR